MLRRLREDCSFKYYLGEKKTRYPHKLKKKECSIYAKSIYDFLFAYTRLTAKLSSEVLKHILLLHKQLRINNEKAGHEIYSAFTYVEKHLRTMKSILNSLYVLSFSYNSDWNIFFYFEIII